MIASGREVLAEPYCRGALARPCPSAGRGFDVGCRYGLVLMPEGGRGRVAHALHVADERLYEKKGSRRRAALSTGERAARSVQVLREYQPELHGHLNEVMRSSRAVGERLGLDSIQLHDLARAAELHDIGKVAVPFGSAPEGRTLDESEWDFVRQHTLVGDRILSAAPALTGRGQARPGQPRALRRHGLPGPDLRQGDPDGGAHRGGLRRVPRDDLGPAVPAQSSRPTRRSTSFAAARSLFSTRRWCRSSAG